MSTVPQTITASFGPTQTSLERFRTLALRYAEIGEGAGIKITPFETASLKIFQRISPESRQRAIESLETIVSIHEDCLALGDSPHVTKRLIWRALSKFSLTSEPDMLDRLQDDDVIFIYDLDQTATFWSLNLFHFTSLTVEQLFCEQWFNYTDRDPEVMNLLVQKVLQIQAGTIRGNFTLGIPPHIVQEVNTSEELRVMMDIYFGSTLYREGELASFLIAKKISKLH